MKNPLLHKDLFLRDEIIRKKILFKGHDFSPADGAVKGKYSVIFNFTGRYTIRLNVGKHNLSDFNLFTLMAKNLSDTPLLTGLKIKTGWAIIFTGDRETFPPGEWMELNFPIESFGSYEASGLMETMEIIFKTEKMESQNKKFSVIISHIEGRYRAIPSGPRLTEKGLKEVLREDFFTEKKQWKLSTNPSDKRMQEFSIPPPCPWKIESPEEIMAGTIMGKKLTGKNFWPDRPLASLEWNHFFHRHHFLRAFELEKENENHIKFLDKIIKEWIIKYPVSDGSNGGAGPSWETLSAGWRLKEWLRIWNFLKESPYFSDETRKIMMKSLWEHGRHLTDYRGHPNNWIIVEASALCLLGIRFPQFKEAEYWIKEGLKRLETEFERQFFPDGVHFELSTLYHAICVNALLDVKYCGEINNIKLPELFNSPLEKCLEYLLHTARPDFTWPSLNDSWSIDRSYKELLYYGGKIFNRPDFIWTGIEGREGKEPEGKTKIFPHGGIGIMRNGFKRDSHYLLLKTGPGGPYHSHEDILSLDISYGGIAVLPDPGITSYEPGVLTDYYRSASAHNTILINGKGPDPLQFKDRIKSREKNIFYNREDSREIIKGIYRGTWDNMEYTVTRKVTFVKKEYWIMEDSVEGEGECNITICWQCYGEVEADRNTFTIKFKEKNFSIRPFLPHPNLTYETLTGTKEPIGGWISVNGKDEKITTVKFKASVYLPFHISWKSGLE